MLAALAANSVAAFALELLKIVAVAIGLCCLPLGTGRVLSVCRSARCTCDSVVPDQQDTCLLIGRSTVMSALAWDTKYKPCQRRVQHSGFWQVEPRNIELAESELASQSLWTCKPLRSGPTG